MVDKIYILYKEIIEYTQNINKVIKLNKKIVSIVVCTLLFSTIVIPVIGFTNNKTKIANSIKSQLSFAAFADTHIGSRYQEFFCQEANYLDLIGEDLTENTNLLDFVIHLGDIVHHNIAQVNGEDLPWYVNQYKNNLKAYLISKVNLPFHFILGNHDINDYEMNADDPHMLTKSIIDETSMNNPVYAMMRDGILFLIVPELAYVHWTHPVEYEWVEYMTSCYPETTTIILSHQAIEDTTEEDHHIPYRGKQDMDWWSSFFQNNSQIKMWIHGHNHYLDWYVNDQTSGVTQGYPIYKFGHQMAFSAPYPQMDWYQSLGEDQIVIYNITSSGVTTATWENNGKDGHWVNEYINSFDVKTTYDPNAEDWYSFPMFLQDNETQLTDMKLLSPNITLQLIGTVPMELFYDSKLEAGNSKLKTASEVLLGFGNDRSGNVEWTKPGGEVHGPTFITFPEKTPYCDQKKIHEDGRSGQPYHSYPMGTICAAIPGQTYNFTMIARCNSEGGRFKMTVNCTDWGTRSQYSTLFDSESQVFSHTFGSNYETIYGTYTVPNDENAWFLQGRLDFLDSTEYNVSLFSVKRERNSDTTDNFHLYLGRSWYNVSGTLNEDEMVNFSVDPILLSDNDGVMNFTAFIDGNHYGMTNLVYHEPLLLGRNARFKINNYSNEAFNISLTKTISGYSPVKMAIWNSNIFKKNPIITEFFSRFLFHGLTGKLIDLLFTKKTAEFKMFPFSMDEMYENIKIVSDDGSGAKNISKNGNIWLTCNCPDNEERFVEITFNT